MVTLVGHRLEQFRNISNSPNTLVLSKVGAQIFRAVRFCLSHSPRFQDRVQVLFDLVLHLAAEF